MKTYKIYTLGCKLNFSESSSISRSMEFKGYHQAERGDMATMVVINSCAVTGESERKTRELIRRTVRENPGAEIVVTGCYAKLRADEITRIEGVSRVETFKELTAYSSGERTRSFLKVQDGCDYHCTYCTVWRARGESRNASVAQIVSQAGEIAASGIREIVLTGVNIGDFGRSTGESFLDLITALDKVQGVDRYRISSIEPNLLTDEILRFAAVSPRFMPHYHIPLQSGSDDVLRRMGRRYRAEFFEAKIASIRSLVPEAFIGVDVIVGFPGETDEHFEQTVALLERVRPSFLHVFPYSARPDTPAADFEGQVVPVIKKARVARLSGFSTQLLAEFTLKNSGESRGVLVEGRGRNGLLFGHTDNYIRTEFEGSDECINTIVERVL